MFRTFFSFVGALIGYVWSFLSRLRWPIVVITTIGIIVFFSITGYAFKVVYDGIILFLIIFAIISLFVQPLRWVLLLILTAGGMFFAYNTIFVDMVKPYIETRISKNLPAYDEWKENEKKLANTKLAERTISAKKEMASSEVTKGTFGTITESSVIYDENGTVISGISLKKDARVMSLGLATKSQSEKPDGVGIEGMAYVLIANEYGDFVKSRSALVPIRKIEWESNKKEATKKEPRKNEWEKVKDLPLTFTGRIFNEGFGPDGEKTGTGEIFSGYVLESGYDYKISFSGTYSEWFTSDPWFNNISWTGWNPQSAGMKKPFPSYPYGALMLRIGDKIGLHPKKGGDFIIFTPNGDTKVFAELNINREIGEYFNPKVGGKIKNSTLSLKIERRPI